MKTFKNLFFLAFCFLATATLSAQTVYDDQFLLHQIDIESADAIATTEDGGHIFAGTSNFLYSIDPNAPKSLYVGRTADDGSTHWVNVYDPYFEDANSFFPTVIAPMTEDHFVIGGTMWYSDELEKSFMMKIDGAGSVQWFHTYDCYSFHNLFDLEWCSCRGLKDIAVTEDDEIGVISEIRDEEKTRVLIFKTNQDGIVTHNVNYFFSDASSHEEGIAIEATNDGFYALAESGAYTNGNLYSQPLLIKLDQNLDKQWSRLYSNVDDNYADIIKLSPQDLVVNDRQECIIMGLRNPQWPAEWNQIFMISVDQNGQSLWDNTLFFYKDTHNSGFSKPKLAIDQANQLYLSFYQNASIDYSSEIEYIAQYDGVGTIKMNAGGAPQWYRWFENEYNWMGFGDMTIAETTNGTTVGLVGNKTPNAVSAWVSRLSVKNGNNNCNGEDALIYSKNLEYISLSALLQKNYHKVIATASDVWTFSSGFTRYRCGDETQTNWMQDDNDQYLQAMQQNSTTAQAPLTASIAPNPTNGAFTLTTESINDAAATTVRIFDTMGKLVHQTEVIEGSTNFDLSHLPSGTYSIKVQSNSQLEQHKMLIQH